MQEYALIMAGGSGTRLWPLSRRDKPKQFLNITGKGILLNETINRLSYKIKKQNIYIITTEEYYNQTLEVTKKLIPKQNIIKEPFVRNTTACITYALKKINKKGNIIITPSDSFVGDIKEYNICINYAFNNIKNNKLLILGIKPTHPSTSYGYIKYRKNNKNINKVIKFVEKPNLKIAKKYIENNYLWNSGIIIGDINDILKKIKKYKKNIYEDITKYIDTNNKNIYKNIENISFDYSVLEPCSIKNELDVIKGDFIWNDVGSFNSFFDIKEVDKNNNIVSGDVISINTKNCLINSSNKLIATVGIKDIIIVETNDVLLVCNKKNTEDIKEIVLKLKDSDRSEIKYEKN